jgi:hypothetical protein
VPTVSAIPTGPEVSLGIDTRPPNPVPAFTPPADVNLSPLPSAATPQPLPGGEPSWKPVGGSVALANPMSAGPERWMGTVGAGSSPIIMVSATGPAWRGPAVTLDAPRAAGTYISRGVSDAPPAPPAIRPASYAAPAPAQRPAAVPAAIRTGIERVTAGRGRDLDVSVRGPASLLVRLRVRYPADAEYLANAISRMPELAPYQVQFEMQVAR